jgi:Ca-activated chloride channel family protein
MTNSSALPLLEESSHSSEPALADAGFGALETVRGRLPLQALDVRARIDGLLAQVVMRQTFVNVAQEPLEATYIFPLPDRAAVTGFRMQVADRVIDGLLKERAAARRDYDRAIRQGHRASIAEEERPGVFTLRVGNLMPGDRATVELTMAAVLPYADGEVTFRFPLVVAPRYIPGIPLDGPSVGDGTAVDTDAVPDASRISPPVLLPGFPNPVRLSLTVDLYHSGVPAEDVRVSLHATRDESSMCEGIHRIILQPGARLDRDFILRYKLGGNAVRTALSLHPDAGTCESGEGTFALTVVPPLHTADDAGRPAPRPRDLAFVLDRSGSMAGWKMVAARRAIARMIDTLSETDRFLLVAFDNRTETPFPTQAGLIPATDRNRFCAVEFLAKLEARGGTEMAEPLWQAVDQLEKARDARRGSRSRRLAPDPDPGFESESDRELILVLVTDGQVGNEDQVLEMIGSRLGRIRIFALGIDQTVNEGFLHRLAGLGASGGSCELVESDNRLDAVMESIHRRIDTPVLTDVTLDPSQAGLEIIGGSLAPDRPPAVFAGSPLLILGRYRGQPQPTHPLRLRARTSEGAPYAEEIAPVVRDNAAIAAAWARGQVRSLEDRYAAGLGDRTALEHSIIATSLRFGVLCRFTAYVAVDRTVIANEGGEVHQITQAVEMPAGWEESSALLAHRMLAPYSTLASDRIPDAFCMAPPPPSIAVDADVCASMGPLPCSPPASTPPDSFIRGTRHSRTRRETPGKAPGGQSPAGPAPARHLALNPLEIFRAAGYVLVEETRRDAFGVVYKAHDRDGKLVSLRLLTNPFNVGAGKKLAQLQKKLKALRHPGIVPILGLIADPSRTGHVIAIVSEYVSEPSLEDWHNQRGPIEPLQIARLVLALAEALDDAANKGIYHGLLAPQRIRVATAAVPRIEDFGLTSLGCHPILPSARAPGRGREFGASGLQQPSARSVVEQADINSLGDLLSWLLTRGLAPSDTGPRGGRGGEKNARAPFWKSAGGSHPTGAMNPQIPAELQAICARALEADPSARYASWSELLADLRKFLGVKKPGWFGRSRGESPPRGLS